MSALSDLIDGRWQDLFLAYLIDEPDDDCFVATSGLDLEAIIAAYSVGVFPMGIGGDGQAPYGWFCPLERAMFRTPGPHISRSLRRDFRHFEITIDQNFSDVLAACGGQDRNGQWITTTIADRYCALHEVGIGHSVEVWHDDALVGGLYGVSLGSFFAGESMFHTKSNASKIAVAAAWLAISDSVADPVFDVQWQTSHLASLGAQEMGRAEAMRTITPAVRRPGPDWDNLARNRHQLIWRDNQLGWCDVGAVPASSTTNQ